MFYNLIVSFWIIKPWTPVILNKMQLYVISISYICLWQKIRFYIKMFLLNLSFQEFSKNYKNFFCENNKLNFLYHTGLCKLYRLSMLLRSVIKKNISLAFAGCRFVFIFGLKCRNCRWRWWQSWIERWTWWWWWLI